MPSITGRAVEQIGKILYGENWRAPFERDFSITNRKLRRVIAGTEDVGTGMAHDLEMALRDHLSKGDDLLELFV